MTTTHNDNDDVRRRLDDAAVRRRARLDVRRARGRRRTYMRRTRVRYARVVVARRRRTTYAVGARTTRQTSTTPHARRTYVRRRLGASDDDDDARQTNDNDYDDAARTCGVVVAPTCDARRLGARRSSGVRLSDVWRTSGVRLSDVHAVRRTTLRFTAFFYGGGVLTPASVELSHDDAPRRLRGVVVRRIGGVWRIGAAACVCHRRSSNDDIADVERVFVERVFVERVFDDRTCVRSRGKTTGSDGPRRRPRAIETSLPDLTFCPLPDFARFLILSHKLCVSSGPCYSSRKNGAPRAANPDTEVSK